MIYALSKRIVLLSLLTVFFIAPIHADTIDHYMNIVKNIPQMEMKADPESQAWARSARNILILTSESVGESLMLANDTSTRQGAPLFCLPPSVHLNGMMLNELIQQTYREISSQQSDKNSMTVSQVALIGVTKLYPCVQQQTPK
ncbi:MAG: phosphatase [Legionellaceae bacterium]|nr:phosphatase [Legionellaceae bacterium]